ncbi:hypothetical protein P153DRAFT_425966 [Dothidotthia symphoricarpi CBS 119687]|uniref:Rhodopsin domain-containing protein n=1 Tax=Dothidotthia symphoricarpi CBS 119687 TaxID=1392245 RepID=A0A6A5ZYT1_9PLEO|nr:uncharacterized protein P153DRAFT_425966 [Dothidotthia symphoricarpi CBS 119687]KAF2124902.1 hypothetical protein P153DRAFT_425966 [Dothidotthia symphoricarpi CBS 119687]
MAPTMGQAVLRDEDQGPVILGATLTVTIAALMTTLTRVYVRLRMIRNVGWDCVVGQIVIIPEVHLGAGRHRVHVDPESFKEGFRLNFVTQPIYLIAICLVKISVGFFLLRIAVATVYRRIIISTMVFMGVYTVGCFLTIMLQCTNLALLWDPYVKGTCWSDQTITTLSLLNVSLNIFTDVLFSAAIPIPLLWSLQMNTRQKMSLICILGLGMFATAAALVKTSYLPSYGENGDWLWDSRNLTIWVVVETNVGIIAGNLPCLKPIFRVILTSTYGRGSCKTEAPRYLTGAGTDHHSVNNYNCLASNQTHEGGFGRSDGDKKSYMLTTINADKHVKSDAGEGSSEAESVWRVSEDSETRPKGLGGIKAITEHLKRIIRAT